MCVEQLICLESSTLDTYVHSIDAIYVYIAKVALSNGNRRSLCSMAIIETGLLQESNGPNLLKPRIPFSLSSFEPPSSHRKCILLLYRIHHSKPHSHSPQTECRKNFWCYFLSETFTTDANVSTQYQEL